MDAATKWLMANITPDTEIAVETRCFVTCKSCRHELKLGDSLGTTTRKDLAWKAGKLDWRFRAQPPSTGWRCPDCSRPTDVAPDL